MTDDDLPEYEYMPYRINSDPAKGWVPLCLIVIGMILFLVILALALAGCEPKGKCIESHVGMMLMPIIVGKSVLLIPMSQRICDKWEK